ncbi:hypothetical protein HPB48_023168 [Haemaphysalis longicornis]|uniref:Uncharacterized protein n=1 Tax=Haemaphysalis longicornis TaxID=44386 RepID=A0A9J6H7B7_HAELO|nr:hypothetical protein HPB48_023168 [Haemaphysalis longicornis]
MVCHKTWRCHLHDHNKVTSNLTTKCPASIDIKVKKVNKDTRRNDAFLRRDPPLCAVMKISAQHNHPTESADALHLLRCNDDTKELFHGYFAQGMTPAAAMEFHESALCVEGDPGGILKLANGALNPTSRVVYHLYEKWRKEHHGTVLDPSQSSRRKFRSTQHKVSSK